MKLLIEIAFVVGMVKTLAVGFALILCVKVPPEFVVEVLPKYLVVGGLLMLPELVCAIWNRFAK